MKWVNLIVYWTFDLAITAILFAVVAYHSHGYDGMIFAGVLAGLYLTACILDSKPEV